jgi:hypothetical protein
MKVITRTAEPAPAAKVTPAAKAAAILSQDRLGTAGADKTRGSCGTPSKGEDIASSSRLILLPRSVAIFNAAAGASVPRHSRLKLRHGSDQPLDIFRA